LAREPDLRRIPVHINLDDPSSMVIKYNHGIEELKRCGSDDKHLDGGDVRHVVQQNAAPSRGGSLGRRGRCLPTVAWLTSIPSLSGSP
jgi:hypothetical protein